MEIEEVKNSIVGEWYLFQEPLNPNGIKTTLIIKDDFSFIHKGSDIRSTIIGKLRVEIAHLQVYLRDLIGDSVELCATGQTYILLKDENVFYVLSRKI